MILHFVRTGAFLLGLVFVLGIAGCAKPKPSGPLPHRTYGSEDLQKNLHTLFTKPFSGTEDVEIIYVTNRLSLDDPYQCGNRSFDIHVSERISYGSCRLNVPKRRAVGGFEKANNPRADPHKFFRVLSQQSLNRKTFPEYVVKQKPADILLFVHGFNVKFEEAVFRTAQIAYDLKFQGPVILFSWPAGAGSGFFESAMFNRIYETNKANAIHSQKALAELLKNLSGLDMALHIMVHSMGHQVVLPALAQIAPEIAKPFVGELILNAPDIALRTFSQFMPAIQKVVQRITVYCSYNDNAIIASEVFNKGQRMGACEQIPGVDVINVGEIDPPALGIGGLGHSYYSSRPILTDIFQVLLGMEAEQRLFIRKSEPNSVENYFLRP